MKYILSEYSHVHFEEIKKNMLLFVAWLLSAYESMDGQIFLRGKTTSEWNMKFLRTLLSILISHEIQKN